MSFRRQATFAVVLDATVAGAIGASALAAHHPGPYAGRTSQDRTMRFTISSDGRFVENAHYRNARLGALGGVHGVMIWACAGWSRAGPAGRKLAFAVRSLAANGRRSG